jgi:outer membrane receptor for ferrienterochelin and colicins
MEHSLEAGSDTMAKVFIQRWELLGAYELPIAENADFLSYTDHDQNSVYGNIPYVAQQKIGFE